MIYHAIVDTASFPGSPTRALSSSILHAHTNYTRIDEGEGEPGMESCLSLGI